MEIGMNDDTSSVLQMIADRRYKRNDAARLYRNIIRYNAPVDIPALNAAIIERWSMSALNYIITEAWKGE